MLIDKNSPSENTDRPILRKSMDKFPAREVPINEADENVLTSHTNIPNELVKGTVKRTVKVTSLESA